jgi:murein DD-endopeptidase MepM/ murein hydrolase activator NlpD
MKNEQDLTILIIPAGGEGSRTIQLDPRARRRLGILAVVAVTGLLLLLGSWVYLAVQAWKTSGLQEEVVQLRADREQMAELSRTLGEVEASYERIRNLFGEGSARAETPDWLPPAGGRGAPAAGDPEAGSPPDLWPLSQRGFLTQPLTEGSGPSHPGIDIAIGEGAYIRAAGAGRVVEAAEDAVYGLFLLIDHGGGYRTLYAHASALLVEPGDPVQRGEVVGLTGSTGRSTAPHLHFEVLRDGEPIDPLSVVDPPG